MGYYAGVPADDPRAWTPEERFAYADRFTRQLLTFGQVTVECSGCERQTALATLHPTLAGLHCEKCMVAMPRAEFDRVTVR